MPFWKKGTRGRMNEQRQTIMILETGFLWKRAVQRAKNWVNHYGKQGFGIASLDVSRGWFRVVVLVVMTNPPPSLVEVEGD